VNGAAAASFLSALLTEEDGYEYPELLLLVAVVVVAVLIGLSPLLNTPAGEWLAQWWRCLVRRC